MKVTRTVPEKHNINFFGLNPSVKTSNCFKDFSVFQCLSTDNNVTPDNVDL